MNKLLFFFLLAIANLLSSCTTKPIGGQIDDTYWTLASMTSGRKVIALNNETKITAVIKDGLISGESICNSYSSKVKLEGVNFNIAEISSTEKACDRMDLENNYLGLLMKASGYSVLKDKMEVFCETGKLVFRPMSETEAKASKLNLLSLEMDKLFSTFRTDTTLHLYPIQKVDNPESYPYSGIMIDPGYFEIFDEKMSEVWSNAGGDVYAIGKHGDLYICRVPGRYVSSDIALFRRQNNKLMKHLGTFAFAWCDEGWCSQQDAWVLDVNKDNLPDVVQHFEYRNDKGKVVEERLSLFLQNANGAFVQNNELRLNKSNFKLAKI